MALIVIAGACGAHAAVAEASLSVPTGGPPVTFTGSGTAGASAAMGAFEGAAGGGDNGTAVGEQGNGFRHLTWDDVALDGSDPGSSVIEPGHVAALSRSRLEPWGIELGPDVAVANDGFVSVNSQAAGLFTPFTAPNVWAPFNSNTAEFDVVVPAAQASTPTPALTRGLGVVFLNVTSSGTTTIQYYNDDSLLGSVSAPAGATSFAGLLFPDAVVTRVVITLGTAMIFGFDGTTVTAAGTGPNTLVAGDDVVLAEPAPARPTVPATGGVPLTAVLDTFTDTISGSTPGDFAATIDWGDGTQTPGTIVPAAGAAFNVIGSHTYARAGSYTADVTVEDFSGSEQTSNTVIAVGAGPTTTSVACSPSPVAVSATTTCTATVSDAAAGDALAPTGTVVFSSPTAGAAFAGGSVCQLGPGVVPGESSCEVRFTPDELPPRQARITAAYAGDMAHAPSGATTTVGVRAQRCGLRVLSARLVRPPAGLGGLVTCDARANVVISAVATAARKGPYGKASFQFGTLRTVVGEGRPTVVMIKPLRASLSALRIAIARHQKVSLKLTLTASSQLVPTTTTKRVSAVRFA